MTTLKRISALVGLLLCMGSIAHAQTTATPVITPGSGSYTGSQSVTITDATSGSTIFYTTDGSTPQTGTPTYLFTGVISGSSAYWGKTCYIGSPQCSGGVGTTAPEGTPTETFGLNTPSASTGTSNAVAHFSFEDPNLGSYTQVLWTSLNGASTTSGSALYITADFWEQSVFAAGKTNLEFDQFLSASGWLYMFGTQCSGANGYVIQYDNETHGWVSTGISCSGMVDGNYHHIVAKYHRDPNTSTACSGAPCEYWDSIQIDSTVYTINATLPATSTTWGEILASQFQVDGDPTSASSGTPALYDLYIDTDTLSASTTPTTSPIYSAPLTITPPATVTAIATASGYSASLAASATYTTASTVAATPTFSPPTGIFSGAQTVTISDATAGATMYYTTDGSTPTTSSSVYSTPLSVTATTTVHAIATASGYSASALGTALYTIGCGLSPFAAGNIDPTQIKASGRLGVSPLFQMAVGGYTLGDLPNYDCNGNLMDSGMLLSSLATKSATQQGTYTYAADTGSANAYAVTLSPAPSIVAGSHVVFKAANANTGASTLAVNGGTATAITKEGATALASGDIAAGQIVEVVFDGTNFQMLASGASGSGGGFSNPMTAAGDVIVGGTSGTPERLGVGSNGQQLGVVNGAPAWITPSGGGGASRGLWSGLMSATPTISSTGLSTHYNESSTFSATNASDCILLSDTVAANSNVLEGLLQAYPSTAYTLTILMTVPLPAANYSGSGLVIASSTSGPAMLFDMMNQGGDVVAVYTFSSPTSETSNLYFSNNYVMGGQAFVWLRLKDDGTNITFYISYDGHFWPQIYTVAKSSSYLGSAGFNYIGFVLSPQLAAVQSCLVSWAISYP